MKTTKTKTNSKSKAKEREIIGLDLGDRRYEVSVLVRGGDVVWSGKIADTREVMAALSRAHRGGLVVMEVLPGTMKRDKCETTIWGDHAATACTGHRSSAGTRM